MLPSRGKVAVVHCGRSSEASLQLPTAPTRQACSQLTPTVWLFIGRLAAHGLAVQVSTLLRVSSGTLLLVTLLLTEIVASKDCDEPTRQADGPHVPFCTGLVLGKLCTNYLHCSSS